MSGGCGGEIVFRRRRVRFRADHSAGVGPRSYTTSIWSVRMRCRGPLVTLLATAAVLTTASAEVTITDNGYSGLLVGISKDVPEDDGPQLIEAIKVGDQADTQTKLFS